MSLNSYTCLTCRVSLCSGESQRQHYKQDWHSYNLRRKLAQLAPVSHIQFCRIEEQHRQPDNTPSQTKTSFYCESCRKQFNNEKAFQQHFESKKHKNLIQNKRNDKNGDNLDKKLEIEVKTNAPEDKKSNERIEPMDDISDNGSDWESVDSNDENEDPIESNECLFCDHSSDTIEDNISHMSEKHSFFIPDIEFIKGLEPLLKYLGEKVGFGHYCLWCCDSGKRFRSRRAAQQHMRDRGHTKMKRSDDCALEYSDFYDYTSSYPDFDGNDANDEEVFIPNLDDEDWQLTLPSGAVIGHRSLFRYYRQNLKPLDENAAKNNGKSSAILDKVMSKYRALGWTGMTGEAALQRSKDVKFVQRILRKQELKIGQKNNTILQKHFRSQIGF